MKIEKFEGLVAAPFTPMNHDYSVNYSMIAEYYNFLEKNGVIGAFINGTTGEGPSLTGKEKMLQAIEWGKCLKSGGKVRIINMVGGTSCMECIENAVISAGAGFSAIAVVAPYYYKPAGVKELAEFIAVIGSSVPEMPVYYYHIPAMTGVSFSMYDFIQVISGLLPNFAGIKYTHEDLNDFMKCLAYDDSKYDLLWGRDENLLSAMVTGCKGAVGSTYNYAAPLYLSMTEYFKQGDIERAGLLQQTAVKMITLLEKYGGMATGKLFMKFIGLDCGKYRMPVTNPDDEIYPEFIKDVKGLGMDKFFSVL